MKTRLLLGSLVLGVAACGRPDGAASVPAEAWDARSDPVIMGLKSLRYEDLVAPKARQGQIDHKPWTGSYWPYNKKDIAWRYAPGGKAFGSFDEQVADAKATPANAALSPAEKYDLVFGGGSFPVTQNSWSSYTEDHALYGDDLSKWSWMGICDGWAPASLAEPPPLNAVVAQSGGKPVVFFEGDMRALASKVYDLNSTDAGFWMEGTRCNYDANHVPQDASGRPVDGRRSATGETFAILAGDTESIGALEVTHDPLHPQPYWLLATTTLPYLSGQFDMYVYRTRAGVAADVQAKTYGARAEQPGTIKIDLYKGCRDVNPATVHLALAGLLSDAAPQRQSFVAQMSRYQQIWNNPVWGFDAEIGKLRPLSQDPPALRVFRSPDAQYVAGVTAHVVYAGGADPAISYKDDSHDRINWQDVLDNTGSDTYDLLDLKYTLEFDADGLVVGGEWDESPDFQINALGFFWKDVGLPTDTLKNGGASPLKYSQLRKLLDCSRQAPNTTVPVDLADGHHDLPAVQCPL